MALIHVDTSRAEEVTSFARSFKGYVSTGQIDNALMMFEEMKASGIKPNAVTFSTLLPGLCDAEKFVLAQNALKEMVDRYIAPKDNSIFQKLLIFQCKSGDLNAAADVLKAMIRLCIPTEAGHYGILIENFCKVNAYDRAVKVLDKLVEKDIILRPPSSLEMQPSAYNPMIEYLCNNGHTSKAETFFRQLMKKGVQDSVAFNNLICGHSKEGNPESAFEIIKIMDRRGVPREANSYRMLVESCLRKVGERMEKDGGSGLDLAVSQSAEGDMLDGGDAGKEILLQSAIFDAIESDNERGRRMIVAVGHWRNTINLWLIMSFPYIFSIPV